MIRAIQEQDFEELYRIWMKFYKDDFPFPDFASRYICAFVVDDDKGKIVSAGGVRTIAESIFITDRDTSVRKRLEALKQLLVANSYVTERAGFKNLNAIVKDTSWKKHLIRIGFKEEQLLYLELS